MNLWPHQAHLQMRNLLQTHMTTAKNRDLFLVGLMLFLMLLFPFVKGTETLKLNETAPSNQQIYRISHETYNYPKPEMFDFLTTLPSNGKEYVSRAFGTSKEHMKAYAGIFFSTAFLLKFDEQIKRDFQTIGRKVGLGNGEGSVGTLKIGSFKLMRRPGDLGSFFYFLGDGWTTIFLSAGFYTASKMTDDIRAYSVSHQLMQGLLLTGISTQIVKRITGRESPNRASRPGGDIRPFPSFAEYQKNTAGYDAFPSGHLATLMTSYMIIAENYAEYTWIKPVGITALSLLAYQMVNNSVHWISDYPLSIGIGYVLGKTIVDRHREKLSPQTSNRSDLEIYPMLSPGGIFGLHATATF